MNVNELRSDSVNLLINPDSIGACASKDAAIQALLKRYPLVAVDAEVRGSIYTKPEHFITQTARELRVLKLAEMANQCHIDIASFLGCSKEEITKEYLVRSKERFQLLVVPRLAEYVSENFEAQVKNYSREYKAIIVAFEQARYQAAEESTLRHRKIRIHDAQYVDPVSGDHVIHFDYRRSESEKLDRLDALKFGFIFAIFIATIFVVAKIQNTDFSKN